jgi:hypothetical protein
MEDNSRGTEDNSNEMEDYFSGIEDYFRDRSIFSGEDYSVGGKIITVFRKGTLCACPETCASGRRLVRKFGTECDAAAGLSTAMRRVVEPTRDRNPGIRNRVPLLPILARSHAVYAKLSEPNHQCLDHEFVPTSVRMISLGHQGRKFSACGGRSLKGAQAIHDANVVFRG